MSDKPLDFDRLSKLVALPRSGVPIARWPSADEAWLDVTRGIMDLLDGRALRRATPQRG